MISLKTIVLACLCIFLTACASPARETQNWPLWGTPGQSLMPLTATKAPSFPENHTHTGGAVGEQWLTQWNQTPVTPAWTDISLELIAKYQANPLRAARLLALLHVAMYDALVLSARRNFDAAQQKIAVHAAASKVLAYLLPQESTGRLEVLGYSAAASVQAFNLIKPLAASRAWETGDEAARYMISRAQNDGSDRAWNTHNRPAAAAGLWRASPPLNSHTPLEPLAGEWRTWILTSGSEIQPAAPPEYGSEAYWEEAREVIRITRDLTPGQKQAADTWNLDHGTVTPGGVWNRIAKQLAAEHALDDAHTARLFAVLNMAMMDAFITCWKSKYHWWTERPVTVIREKVDADFTPYLITPAFPSYVSGHATVSGAAAEVLATFFPLRRNTLEAQAEEAARSRVYGGIHFNSDVTEGLKLGKKVGQQAMLRVGLAATAGPGGPHQAAYKPSHRIRPDNKASRP